MRISLEVIKTQKCECELAVRTINNQDAANKDNGYQTPKITIGCEKHQVILTFGEHTLTVYCCEVAAVAKLINALYN